MEKEKDGRKGKGWKGEGRDRAVTAWGQDKHTWLIPNWIIPSKRIQRIFPLFNGKAAWVGLSSQVSRNPWVFVGAETNQGLGMKCHGISGRN